MAVLSQITCEGCGVTTHVSHSPANPAPKLCGPCRERELGSKRDRHLAELDALSVEERLRRIEAWIYDYRPQYVETAKILRIPPMRERKIEPEPRHAAFRTDLLALLDKHAGHLDCSEMLALASHAVGQIVALQDQRTMSRDRAMAIVARNIEVGNAEVIENLLTSKGEA